MGSAKIDKLHIQGAHWLESMQICASVKFCNNHIQILYKREIMFTYSCNNYNSIFCGMRQYIYNLISFFTMLLSKVNETMLTLSCVVNI